MKIERNDIDKIWQDFVVEESKLIAKEETKIFDAIMDVGAAARLKAIKFPYRKYLKEDTSYDNVLDAFRLALKGIKVVKKERLIE